MRYITSAIILILLLSIVSPAKAGITVTSFDTQAQANAYAPLDKSAYYTDHSAHNTSPAIGNVSEDWTGTNVGGTETTWHMTASVHTDSTTNFNTNALTISGAGSFAYDINTTAGFSEPLQHATLFTPGAISSVGSVFTIDQSANYSLTATLGHLGNVYFASFAEGGVILDKTNFSSIPKLIIMNGTISVGRYQIGVTSNASGPSGLPDGINHVLMSGSYDDFHFTVQVPEPSYSQLALLLVGGLVLQRARSGTSGHSEITNKY